MDLPDEILLMIFGFLNHHRHFHPLLLVSRSFNRLAEPLLYREINFYGPSSHLYPAALRVEQLAQTIASQPDERLANYVKSFSTFECDMLHDILPVMPNLRRLNIFIVEERHCLPFRKLLSPSVQLTHLRMVLLAKMVLLKDFLESQPTLEHLDVSDFRVITRPFPLSPHALSRLRVFGAACTYMQSILRGRAIRHLKVFSTFRQLSNNAALAKVHTLHIVNDTTTGRSSDAIEFACQFPNLRYLAIDETPAYFDAVLTDTITVLRPLAVTNVKYLSLQLTRDAYTERQFGNPARYPSQFTACFVEAVPTLRVLDVGWIEQHNGYQGLRFTVGVPDPAEFKRPKEDYASWALWWENRGLEDIFD